VIKGNHHSATQSCTGDGCFVDVGRQRHSRAGTPRAPVARGEGDAGGILRDVGAKPARRRAAGSRRGGRSAARERLATAAAAGGAAGSL